MTNGLQTTRQPINRTRANVIEIPYEDDLLHHLDDDDNIIHDPAYPDPNCPCYDDEDEQGDTTSDYALALRSYRADFYSIAPAGYNTGGLCVERQIAERVLRGAA